jgi:hypothetical protein
LSRFAIGSGLERFELRSALLLVLASLSNALVLYRWSIFVPILSVAFDWIGGFFAPRVYADLSLHIKSAQPLAFSACTYQCTRWPAVECFFIC